MIKTFIKHWVYELCIQQLFKGFSRNFRAASKLHNVKVGDSFRYIIIIASEEQKIRYFNPEVSATYNNFFTIKGNRFVEEIMGEPDTFYGNYEVNIYSDDGVIKYFI